ncbi:hypothetical protein CKO23_15920 [Thiocystis violacea]|nr:hypothetical protein [Thiocystis violacea]
MIRPRFSPRLAVFAAATHSLAFIVVWLLPIGALRFALASAVLASGFAVFHVHLLRRAPWSIRSATWQADGAWSLTLVSGRELDVSLSASSFVSLPLVILNFRRGWWHRYALPLAADAMEAEQLRRLRQRLRIVGTGSISALESG